jgi:hypothetical protein
VVPEPDGNFSVRPRSPSEMRMAIDAAVDQSPKISVRRLAARLGVLDDDPLFREQLALVKQQRARED